MELSKKSQTISFFNSIMDTLKHTKIKAIFSLSSMAWGRYLGHRNYHTDAEVYILLENGYCCIIDYPYIDALDIQFRPLTSAEEDAYRKCYKQDFFNLVTEIHDYHTNRVCRIETCQLDYGCIVNVSLRSVINDYEKWIDGDITSVSPTYETFDEITFTMSNGKSFSICAGDAEESGYCHFRSKDTHETICEV